MKLSNEEIRLLAKMAGLEIEEDRLERVAARVQAIREDLDSLDDLALAGYEPAITFHPQSERSDAH